MCGEHGRQTAWAALPNGHYGRKLIGGTEFHAINIVPADPLVRQDGSQSHRRLLR